MDVGRAFRFVFEDRDWVAKLLLGGVILLIPIFGVFALTGYMIAVIRRVLNADPNPLPDWSELGQRFVDGLLVSVAGLVYALPGLLLACPIFFVWVLPALGGESEDLATALASVAGIVAIGLSCIVFLYGLLLVFLTPVIYLQYAGYGRIGACLRVGDIARFTLRNVGDLFLLLLIVVALSAGISLVASLIGGVSNLIPCVGPVIAILFILATLPASVWLMAFQAHLIGQIGRKSGLPSPR